MAQRNVARLAVAVALGLSAAPRSRDGCSWTTSVNERVEVDRTACVPTVLTRVISLGVRQWCPADASWSADVIQPVPPPPPTAGMQRPVEPQPERQISRYRPSVQ